MKDEQNKIKVQTFLDTEVADFASYSTVRAIASVIDGLKNAGRKVIYSTKHRPNKEAKVSILAGIIMSETEYLHGDISGSIISLAQNFPGSNNIPLLTREGNFGTRFTPEASATRYIFTNKEKYFNDIFKSDDDAILIEQNFEGVKIEPRFFVPTIPLIVVNGSEGIATGFAQKILPRNLKDTIRYIKSSLKNTKKPELLPYFNDFNGTVHKQENINQFLIKGVFERIAKNKIRITELPVGYSLDSYIKVLDKLQDTGVIRNYVDKSENNKFIFEVQFDFKFLTKNTDNNIFEKLKLQKKVSENYTCIDENNRIIVLNNIYEVIDKYIDIKMKYIKKRKEYKINLFNTEIEMLQDKVKFIKAVINNTLIINKQKYDNIVKKSIQLGIKYIENHIRMSVQSFTFEKLKELNDEIKDKKENLISLKKMSESNIWIQDLDNLRI